MLLLISWGEENWKESNEKLLEEQYRMKNYSSIIFNFHIRFRVLEYYDFHRSNHRCRFSLICSLLQFGLTFFWQKNIGTKAACKMLMKLTIGPDQTSNNWDNFSLWSLRLLMSLNYFCKSRFAIDWKASNGDNFFFSYLEWKYEY